MNKTQLKREARTGKVRARIISDGCRDYLLHIDHNGGSNLLRNRIGQPTRFRSLTEVNALLRRCHVFNSCLTVRIADDEAGPSFSAEAAFNDLPLATSH